MGPAWALLFVLANVGESATASDFAGFSSDGARYLVGKDLVCTPLGPLAASGAPACEKVTDRNKLRQYGFQKAKRQRRSADGALRLVTSVSGETQVVVTGIPDEGGAEVRLVAWNAGEPIAAVKGVIPSPDGGVLAVELQRRSRADRVEVVAFRLPSAAPAPVAPAPAPVVTPGQGNAHDRAMRGGGKWSQTLAPCEEAGVDLALTKAKKFNLVIKTRCQGEKWTTRLDGNWTPEGADTVVLEFTNEGAPADHLVCRLKACEGKDCLVCALEDISFTLRTTSK